MHRTLSVSLLAVAIFGMAAVAAPIISPDSTYYMTTIQSPSLVVHTFVLSNEGDEVLEIADVVPSCSCTTTELVSSEIPPGESSQLLVRVDTTGFAGLVLREVYVFSNDPEIPALTLSIEVEAPDRATPSTITLEQFQQAFYLLVDVRTQEEHDAGHLMGSVLIPLSEIQQNLDAWTPYLPHDVPIIVYCKAGVRSATAAQILLDVGFENVIDLLGGMDEWIEIYGAGYLVDNIPVFSDEPEG